MNPAADHIRQVVESFYADIWNRRDASKLAELLHDGFSFRGSLGPEMTGHDSFWRYVEQVHQALAGYTCEIEEVVIESPKAFARMRFSGLHQGVFIGYAPTGEPVEWSGAALFTFEDLKVSSLWVLGDVHGLMQLLKRQAGGAQH